MPTLGIHYLFLAVPPPDQVEATQQRLAAHNLKPLVFGGHADLSRPDCVETLAEQLAVCEKLGVKYLFLSPTTAPPANKWPATACGRRATWPASTA